MREAARKQLIVKIASEPWEFEQIHALNHQTFTGEIPQHPPSPSGRLIDRFHNENVYVIGVDERRVAGMIAIRDRRPFALDQLLPHSGNLLCVATMEQGRCLERFVVKEVPPWAHILCPENLLRTHEWIRSQDPQLAQSLPVMLDYVWRYCVREGFDLALISGTTRQLKLYAHLGFVPFGPLVGTPEALFQPMMLTLERFAPRAPRLGRAGRV